MASGYQIGWKRLIPFLGYHHLLMILIVIGILLLILDVLGCTTNGLSDVYLLSLSYANISSKYQPSLVNSEIAASITSAAANARLEVRSGYRGMCISSGDELWICSSSALVLADTVRERANGDPLNLIWISDSFRQSIIFDGLIYITLALAAITVFLLATFPNWHSELDDDGSEREVKPFPSKKVSWAALGVLSIAAMLGMVSVLWQHIVSASTATIAQDLGYGNVKGHVGYISMVLAWTSVTIFAITSIGLLVMVISQRVLAEIVA